MKRLLLLLLILIAMLIACSANHSGGKPKIGVTIFKSDDNFMAFVRRAIERNRDKAELLVHDSQNDQRKQNQQVDSMIEQGVEVLAINLVDPQGAGSIITKAKVANRPILFFNKEPSRDDMNSYDKVWYIGTDSSEAGRLQGQLIVDTWKAHKAWDKNGDGRIQYVMLTGEPRHPDTDARTKFTIETITRAGIDVERLEQQTGMWEEAKGRELMDAWLAKHGDKIEFVIANNDAMALGAIQSLKTKDYFTEGKFMPVVGVDAIPDAQVQIAAGTMVGSVLNDAKRQGQATFDLAFNLAQGKEPTADTAWELGADRAIRIPHILITKQNLSVAKDAFDI